MNGLFITIEGNDGSGKTTIINGIKKMLNEKGIDYIQTREPGGSEIAEKIRQIILDKNNDKMDARTEALLYAASRRQHIVEVVLPALKAGKLVLCDRFVDSSLAYQGYARGIGIDEVYKMNQFATEGLLPDLTIYLTVTPQVGIKRKSAQKELDRLERENLGFHEKVYQGYQKVVEMFPDRIVAIDGERDAQAVIADTVVVVEAFLNQRLNKND
ncbi:MAG: dTMP kinase [Acholeplasmataceae bacterium]|jgi:dTMP kinase|nr:dTMP kinase [Acholeplasmataceae bacterium]HPX19884.1 dTMP kinase [Bacilli bacterium]